MTNHAIGAGIAALLLAVPAAAPAQRLSPAAIAVVDTQRISNECTACRAAAAQLQSRVTALRTRQQTLQTQLRTEGAPIQTAVNALGGRAPDAALQGRISAFETRQNNANQELQRGENDIRSIQANVGQQIRTRLLPIINQVMTSRGASIVVDKGSTLANAPNLEITNEVLAALNQQLPSVSVTPLAQSAQQQPTGR